jgi:hypothetical protein
VSLRHDQRIAQRDLRYFAIPQHAPAVTEEPVTVRVKELGERTGRAHTQGGRDLGVIHGQKLEQTSTLSHLFNVTSA